MNYENLTFAILAWLVGCASVGCGFIMGAVNYKSADLLLSGFFIAFVLSIAGCSVLAFARCFTK